MGIKRLVLISAVLVVLFSTRVYAGEFGPVGPAGKDGQFTLGAGYFLSQTKIRPGSNDFFDEAEIRRNEVYLQAGYSFTKNWEAYVRLGGADFRADNAFEFDSGLKDFSDGMKPFAAVGIRGLAYSNAAFGIGPFLQTSFYSDFKKTENGRLLGLPVSEELKFKGLWELDLGAVVQVKLKDVVCYAGPVVYWTRTKVEAKGTVLGAVFADEASTFKEKENVGGFGGLRVPLAKGLNLGIEAQAKGRLSVGGVLTYSF